MNKKEQQIQERVLTAKHEIAAIITKLENDLGCVVAGLEMRSVSAGTMSSSYLVSERWFDLTVSFPGDLR